MNKKYIKPASEAVLFKMENMIASSPGAKNEVGNGDWNSKRGGWDSSDWTASESEEE